MKLFRTEQIIVNTAIKGWGVSIDGREAIAHVTKESDVHGLIKALTDGKVDMGKKSHNVRKYLRLLLTDSEHDIFYAKSHKKRYFNNHGRTRKHA